MLTTERKLADGSVEMHRPGGILLILAGYTGVGKDHIMAELLKSGYGFSRIVTCASRKPRPGEHDGRDYHFIRPEGEFDQDKANQKFLEMVEAGEIFEYVKYDDHYKGTPKSEILKVIKGRNVIWRIDLSRAGNIEDFFEQNFDRETAIRLLDATMVILVDVPGDAKAEILKRAKSRPGFNPQEVDRRFREEAPHRRRGTWPYMVYNYTGEADNAIGLIRQFISRRRHPNAG